MILNNSKMAGAFVLAGLLSTGFATAQQVEPFSSGWTLESSASDLNFMSVKKGTKMELSKFATLDGIIAEDGTATFEVALDSVDTNVDLRNVRMRFLLFETFAYPKATISTKLTAAMLGDLAREGCNVDAYWADDARIDEHGTNEEAHEIARVYDDSGWRGLYFGGTCFKKQREVAPEHYADAAREASGFMDVVTTSGVATGQEAELGKIETFRKAIGDQAMALASGITPENATYYADVDCFMVATGINEAGNFYDIDPEKLTALMRITRDLGKRDKI